MSNYTEGPWAYDTDSGKTFMVYPDTNADDGRTVCRGIRNEDDAKLIADAKNLLAALRELHAAAENNETPSRQAMADAAALLERLPA